ncbi:MAG TPA: hypothetical protein VFR58_06125 [Flavisolibacter sp.]|nr:hypothetical protein [Flavisolibacter sp.]
MKKIHAFLLLLALCGMQNFVKAQPAFCAGITVQVLPNDPQTGPYNYFGIRIVLDQVYDQSVTVSGYIYDEGNGVNMDHPFSITVPAGYLSEETPLNFYQTDPTASAAAVIDAVSPAVISSGGISYSTSCWNSSTPLDRLNTVGQLHNDYQASLLQSIAAQNMDLRDTTALKAFIEQKTGEFLSASGLPNYGPFPNHFGGPDGALGFNPANYSAAGAAILDELEDVIDNYDVMSETSFFQALHDLQYQSLSLSPDEVYTVGIPVTVAIYSFSYWKDHAEDWAEVFVAQDSIRNSNTHPQPIALRFQLDNASELTNAGGPNAGSNEQTAILNRWKPNVRNVGKADVKGAIGGAIGGSSLGPGGSLAIGVLGSATSSLYDLADQIIGHFTGWW